MRKFINVVLVLIIIAGILNLCDLYSGYKLSLGVDKVFTTEENKVEPTQSKTDTEEEELNNYLYRNLNKDDQKTYDTIYNAVLGFKSPVFVGYFDDVEDAFDIFRIVLSEHPEIFWCSGKCSFGAGGFLNIDYVYSKSEALEKKKLIEQKADKVISGLGDDEYTIALACYEYVILNTSYDKENIERIQEIPADLTIEGVFLNNTAVCSGYAKAYQYLLHRAGLKALYIVGIGTNPKGSERHGWIVQQIDGKYYYSDPTWDDSEYENVVCHNYFCITASEITANHELDDIFPLLTANSLEANYYVREKRYFDKYSLSNIRNVISENLEENSDYIDFKFKTDAEYEKAKEKLFDDREIFIAFKPLDLLKYSINIDKSIVIKDDRHRTIVLIYSKEE